MYDYGKNYYCFSCNTWFKKDGAETTNKIQVSDLIKPEVIGVERRGLSTQTTSLYGYGGGFYNNKKVQIAPYYYEGSLVAQHIRFDDEKDFRWIGDTSKLELFGQHLWSRGGLKLVITEGEIDCMSLSQVQGNKYPVVSVPSGASSVKKYLTQNFEYIDSFKEIILAFDNDEAGRKATEDAAFMFNPKKVKVVDYGDYKDYNEMLLAGKEKEMISSVFNAQLFKPDGIISGNEITFEMITKSIPKGYETPFKTLNEKLFNLRQQEITIFCSGSGLGKSSILRELQYAMICDGVKVGSIFLEESVSKTAQGLIAIDNNIPLYQLRFNPDVISEEEYKKSIKKLLHNDMIYFYDHFGSLDSENLINKIRFLRTVCEVDYIFLDHISIVISGQESNNERKDIDMLMTKLRSLVEETGVGIIAVVHLKRKEGKPYNEGGKISLTDLRGSGSLEQLSDNVIGLERNQLAEDEEEANTTTLKVLKCRETGNTGYAGQLLYDRETGRMIEIEEEY
jgi:twinkle protein